MTIFNIITIVTTNNISSNYYPRLKFHIQYIYPYKIVNIISV